MSHHMVALNIVRQPSPFAPPASRTKTKSCVNIKGSVADLRKALLEDQVIQPGDKFYTVTGQPFLNASEANTQWTDALQEILVVGADNTEVPAKPVVTHHAHVRNPRVHAVPTQLPPQGNPNVIATPVARHVATVHVPRVHLHAVKAVEEIPPVTLSSAESDGSDTKTLKDIPSTPSFKHHHHFYHAQVPATPSVVVAPVQEVLPILPDPVLEVPSGRELLPEPAVVVEPEVQAPVVAAETPQDVAATVPFCPCEDCQLIAVAPVVPAEYEPTPIATAVIEQPEPVATAVIEEPEPVATAAYEPPTATAVDEPPTAPEEPEVEDPTALSDDEKDLLVTQSGLGCGLDISDVNGPIKTAYPVVAQVALPNVQLELKDADSEYQEILVTSSTRTTSYTQSGWAESCLSVEHPWATDDVKTTHTEESQITSVTGRSVYSKCELALQGEVAPHPDFASAIQNALAVENAAKRSEELGKVFHQYGHVYVTSVELGGMKHTTFGRALTETETQDTLVEEMRLALSQTSAADRFSECPCPECAAAVSTDETDLLETVGGIVQPSGSTSEWKASLEDRANWSLTRTTRVESVINLFDDVTRARILAVVPQAVIELEAPSLLVDKVPLHRLFSSKTGIHFYTTKSAEVDSAVRSYGYNYETLACHILPEQAENTVPLYRIHKGNKPLYTIDPEERAKADVGGPAHGLVGFVHATQQTGTFPLYRIFNPRTNAYLFTTNVNEKESLLNVGWNNEGVACYVYL